MQNFLDSNEYNQWKQRCAKQRKIAYENPCYDPAMVTCEDFEVSCGPNWNLRIVLETFTPKPIWHASISHFKTIGGEVVYDKATNLPIFEVPQDALVMVKDWDHEEKDTADSLLGDLVGPLIATKDQRVNVFDVGFARHWILDAQEVAKNVASRN